MSELLRKIPLFASLRDEELDAINHVSVVKTFPKDRFILLEKEEGDSLFIILKGKVKVTSFSEHGKEVIFSILGDGDFFGEMSILDGKPRSASVVAAEDSVIRTLRRADFYNLMETYPRIAFSLLEVLTQRLRRADERIESMALLDVSGRIAGILLQLADEKGVRTDRGILIKARPTHQELANMVGTTRETVTRALKQLERRKYILISGKDITIVDPTKFKNDLYF
jgi:CRP/FNR family transcriptional regulator/CRP/FNR family cyclic AMP-dependent transcriptional regulator